MVNITISMAAAVGEEKTASATVTMAAIVTPASTPKRIGKITVFGLGSNTAEKNVATGATNTKANNM